MATANLRCPQLAAPLHLGRARRRPNSGVRVPIPTGALQVSKIQAFQRSDIDGFAKRIASGEFWQDAWRSANDGFERFLFEAKKTAERLNRQYSVSRRFDSFAQSAVIRAREIDRELEIGTRWRAFSMDFARNLPRYRKQLNDFLDTPVGRSFATIFFLWLALSGWLFRILIFATWFLPFAAPLVIGAVANNLVIKLFESLLRVYISHKMWTGACPACKRQFVGYKNQIIRCQGCGNTVWQPKKGGGPDFFNRDRGGSSSSKKEPEIIDVEFEEK